MLVSADLAQRRYRILLSESTDSLELVADISYLCDLPSGALSFDFSGTAPNMTMVGVNKAIDELPGNFGFHPLDCIIEQLSFIRRLSDLPLLSDCFHQVSVVLPEPSSHLGRWFAQLGVNEFLADYGLQTTTQELWEPAGARDDKSRRVLIPLTELSVNGTDSTACTRLGLLRHSMTQALSDAFSGMDAVLLANIITDVLSSLVKIVKGGIVASIWFPATGYAELGVVNATDGPIGAKPSEQLDGLIGRLESLSQTFGGVCRQIGRCCGTLQISNGCAAVLVGPDSSLATRVDRLDLPSANVPGLRAAVVFQLPGDKPVLWERLGYERVAEVWKAISSGESV